MAIDSLFDALLAISLLWIGWRIVTTQADFNAVLLFIGFGLLLALAWARLAAPDIALAEAAIGSGISGVLLLEAWSALKQQTVAAKAASPLQRASNIALLAGVGLFAIALIMSLFTLPPVAITLASAVDSQLAQTGVSHPVTAVLLNYRGYDTLLEVMVVLLALIAIVMVMNQPNYQQAGVQAGPSKANNSQGSSVSPLLILLAIYVLWAGAHQPGGAFQAAAVLTGCILLLGFTSLGPTLQRLIQQQQLATLVGLLVFGLVAILTSGATPMLTLPPAYAGGLILLIESFLTLSLGLMLAGFAYALATPAGSAVSNNS